jgi:proteasome lid subunit RPN8/RPN11
MLFNFDDFFTFREACLLAAQLIRLEQARQLSMSFELQIPIVFYEEMVAQARAEFPNECCGLLGGTISGDDNAIGRVSRRYPLVNALASPVEYLSEPTGMFRAVRDMRQQGIEVLAVYHSHPSSEPVPSMGTGRTAIRRRAGLSSDEK